MNLEHNANEAFYAWEAKMFPQGIESNLSDVDRELFVTGYVAAILNLKHACKTPCGDIDCLKQCNHYLKGL
jgi:hypothetical protein